MVRQHVHCTSSQSALAHRLLALYGSRVLFATLRRLCLIPVIGGVCLASIKELDFSVAALAAACIANLFAAFRCASTQLLNAHTHTRALAHFS